MRTVRFGWTAAIVAALAMAAWMAAPVHAQDRDTDRVRERLAAYFDTVQVAAQDDVPVPEEPLLPVEDFEPAPLELPDELPMDATVPADEPYYEEILPVGPDGRVLDGELTYVEGEAYPETEFGGDCIVDSYVEGGSDFRSAHGGWHRSYDPEPMFDVQEMMRPMGQMLGDIWIDTWVAQGFTWNGDSPANRFNAPVTFNDRSNEYQLNQIYLSVSKRADGRRGGIGFGGQVDLLYGSDYFFTTAAGLETNTDGTQKWNSDNGPRGAALYGFAMPQMYAESYLPVGQGLSVKMGHFYTILGYESVRAPSNFFYSHSYSMQYGEPFTHTGMLASQRLGPDIQIQGGMTRGWDTWEDVNNDLGWLAGFEWSSRDGRSTVAFALHSGAEQPEPPNQGGERTTYSLIFTRQLADGIAYVVQHDRGFEDSVPINPNTVEDGDWYSIVQYFLADVTNTVSAGFRVEWFRDEDGTRVEGNGLVGDYFSCTWGLNVVPLDGVIIRPEIRWDWTNTTNAAPFDDGSDRNQVLASTDVILRY